MVRAALVESSFLTLEKLGGRRRSPSPAAEASSDSIFFMVSQMTRMTCRILATTACDLDE